MGQEGIGDLLRRLRDDSGMTLQQVADAINDRDGCVTFTGKEVGRYLREKRIPTSRIRGYLADLFGVDLSEINRAAAVSRRRRQDSASPSVPEIQDVSRLSARQGLALDASEAAEFARFIATTNVSSVTLEEIHADVVRLARNYVSRPLGELHGEIGRLRRTTFALAKGRQSPANATELYLLAGRLCGLSAHVCLDAGDYESAAAQSRTSWACADLVGHNGLRAWTRAAQSLIAFWNGSPQLAAELARAGREFVVSGSIGARLASLEARSLAAAGDHGGAAAALVVADCQRESVGEEDEFPGVFVFPAAKQFAYAGTTQLAMGGSRNVRAAITSSETAVRLYRSGEEVDRSVGDLFAAHLDMARAHMKAGDIDGTEAMVTFVLDAPPATRSASIARRLAALGDELDAPRFHASTVAARVRDRLGEAVMTSAPPSAGQEQDP